MPLGRVVLRFCVVILAVSGAPGGFTGAQADRENG